VERGCGLDVHQATVVACLLIVSKNGKIHKQVRTFGTTRELLSLADSLDRTKLAAIHEEHKPSGAHKVRLILNQQLANSPVTLLIKERCSVLSEFW